MSHHRRMSVIAPVLTRELEKVEWGGPEGSCPSCHASRDAGHHRKGCTLRGALNLALADRNAPGRTRDGALAVIAGLEAGTEYLAPEIAQGVVDDDPHLEAVGT